MLMAVVYTVMWFCIGLILLFYVARSHKIFYLAGGYFIVMGLWWLLDILLEVKMFEGVLGVVFKIFSGLVLIVLGIFFAVNYGKGKDEERDN